MADSVALGSTDAFAGMPARRAAHRRAAARPAPRSTAPAAADLGERSRPSPTIRPDTSSAVTVNGGPFARRAGAGARRDRRRRASPTGRGGAATDQSINYSFNVTVLATDSWWNPVGGVSDVVASRSDDPLATLPPDQALVDGRAELPVRLARGGYNQITVVGRDPSRDAGQLHAGARDLERIPPRGRDHARPRAAPASRSRSPSR